MNRKQKKELRRRLSTRQLMGIDQLTACGLKTARSELVFYLVSPDNLSVLSAEGVRNRVRALTELLRGMEAVELLALDSRESFQSNKHHYQARQNFQHLLANVMNDNWPPFSSKFLQALPKFDKIYLAYEVLSPYTY